MSGKQRIKIYEGACLHGPWHGRMFIHTAKTKEVATLENGLPAWGEYYFDEASYMWHWNKPQ